MSTFTQELADGFEEAAVGVGMGITIRHKGRTITAIEDTQTAALEFGDGGPMEVGVRTFICRKSDFGSIPPLAEQLIEVLANPNDVAGKVVHLRIQNPETKAIDPTVRLVCRPETE